MFDNFRWTFFFSMLMFSYSNYIIYDLFNLSYNSDSGTEFITTRSDFGKNDTFFYFTCIIYPYWVFVKRDKLLIDKI
jgi:hypothetical protein